MFEAHVLHLLRRYLGEYVEGLSAEALRISVWQGDVVLKDLKLKTEALSALKLPATVKAGFIGTITLKVPWKSLGKEPVIVLIDRVFILAHPVTDGRTLTEDRDKIFEAKLQEIEEAESATLEAISKSKIGSRPYSWGSVVAVGSGYASGKDLTVMDQVSLSRQYTSKQENKSPNVTFQLNQLEKKYIPLCCTSTVNKQLWLSVGADASVLHTELNAPVYDWRISVNSPVKLENRLPCAAEFTLWEKIKEEKCIERQNGMIPSRGGVHIYQQTFSNQCISPCLFRVAGSWRRVPFLF